MMTRQKHFGYLAALPDGGPGVLRKFKQPFRKAFFFGRDLIPKHAGYKPHCRVNQGLCCDLAPGEDKITKTDLFHAVMIQNALVHAFESTAQKGDAVAVRKPPRHRLIKGLSAR